MLVAVLVVVMVVVLVVVLVGDGSFETLAAEALPGPTRKNRSPGTGTTLTRAPPVRNLGNVNFGGCEPRSDAMCLFGQGWTSNANWQHNAFLAKAGPCDHRNANWQRQHWWL